MHTTDDTPDEDAMMRPQPHGPRTRFRDEPDDPQAAGAEPELFDPFGTLLGAVVMVPNRHWGFEGVTSTDHPGACTHVEMTGQEATLVKGTDAENIRNARSYLVVEPTPENHLSKPTAFELVPRRFRVHRLKLYFLGRQLGYLDGATLQALRTQLARLHPEE